MSEYWVSQGRKFCDYCKCWIADNKSSKEFHENGKKHKENVERRLKEIRKKGVKDSKKSKEEDMWIRQMEEAALKAYEKDLRPDDAEVESAARNTSFYASSIGPQLPKTNDLRSIKAPTSGTKWHNPKPKKWHETKTEDGQIYYWNVETNETQWEKPEDGVFSIKEQEKKQKYIAKPSVIKENSSQKRTSSKQLAGESKVELGSKRHNPYGSWQVVEESKCVDYQLPSSSRVDVDAPILHAEEPFRFKEKVVGSVGLGSSSFKKPKKFNNKNFRQRNND